MFDKKNDISNFIHTKIGERFSVINDEGYIKLLDKEYPGIEIMSNSQQEKTSNTEIVERAKGDVLIAGLGIGLILLPIQNKKEVQTVTVVEKYSELIELVLIQLPINKKLNFILEDFYEFKPKQKYDTIYIDLYPDAPMTLVEQYRNEYLNENGFCSHFEVRE